MKTKILLLSLMTAFFAVQLQAQNRTRVNAMNDEISDNLDLRAIASIFGDSRNLQDFERRLNDPKLQISNLDLNYDDEVDYLRVIETVEGRTHVIIIQSVLDRDVYQDVATIDAEKDRNNQIHVQVVGNAFMYGPNYIYEPVYYTTPYIYASFWASNYRPYYSNWYWNYYPSYYYAWNPYPIFRYRNNISICLNLNNNYNYVNYRRSSQAVVLYNSRRSNSYERQNPNQAFSRRNANVTNRYELDQRRDTRNVGSRNGESRNEIGYLHTRSGSSRDAATNRTESNRNNSQNRSNSSRDNANQRVESNRGNSSREATPQREYSQNRGNSSREATSQRVESNRGNSSREATPQREYSQNRGNSSREATPQRVESNRGNSSREATPQRDNSQSRNNTSRQATPQRVESNRGNSSREASPQRDNSSRQASPQRTESKRENSSSRNGNGNRRD
ncbi:hypothetical protein [Flavobacterium sp. K5-23]|uniref:hypothetical protein n=1 Tax=Flavobacterium sp. K5-23 TaxID=2746225 RepID=UPI00200DF9A0|nr:hypothetical protein [Flavobacterium sp. K5-23]UQD56550.1 hypothetical protein FLAK523_09190 [Flavobacterium sp. K5-23]